MYNVQQNTIIADFVFLTHNMIKFTKNTQTHNK